MSIASGVGDVSSGASALLKNSRALDAPGSTRLTSDWIKGVCMLIVCWHHLICMHFPEKFSYLGHQFVVFFFILSGYGLYKSLDSKRGRIATVRDLLVYILKRAGRIYPLYWLWLLVCYDLSKLTGSDFFLLSLRNPPVWFLNAIVYCYIFAPLLFYITKRTGYWSIVIYSCGALLTSAVLDYMKVPSVLGIAYCKLYFSYIFAFGCGMALAKPAGIAWSRLVYGLCVGASTVLFVVSALQISMFHVGMIDLSRIRIYYYPVNPYVFPFFCSAIFLTFLLMNRQLSLPFARFLVPFGKYSLAIYLFHTYYVKAIVDQLGLQQPEIYYFAIFIVLLPVLLIGCAVIETLVDKPSWAVVSWCIRLLQGNETAAAKNSG